MAKAAKKSAKKAAKKSASKAPKKAAWSSIENHLQLLEMEKLIVIKRLDRVVVCITSSGIETIHSLSRHHMGQS